MTLDVRSSLFWLSLSVTVTAQSFRMGIGTLQNPGMGFMPFWAGGLLAILSFVLFFRAILEKKKVGGGSTGYQRAAALPEEAKQARVIDAVPAVAWRKKVFLISLALVCYAVIMPVTGYLIGTFLFMTFLYWFAEPTGIRWFLWSLLLSFLTTAASYYVFSVLLNCQFPSGILGI
jgi:tripartite tricarboxylate transporter TctB family protein